jgi:hypothetical protein
MKRFISCLGLVMVLGLNLIAGRNWYVTPTGSGNRLGGDWANAKAGFAAITWGPNGVGAGDVLYMAGGNYGGLSIEANGSSSGGDIIVRRATNTDHGTNTGWNSTMDKQVVVQGIGMAGQAYITIDGATKNGIYTDYGSIGVQLKDAMYCTIKYVQTDGKKNANNYCGAAILYSARNITLSHCTFSNIPNDPITIFGANHVIEYCTIGPRIPSRDGHHADAVEIAGADNVVFRYNTVVWDGQGLFFNGSGKADKWEIYGNVMRMPLNKSATNTFIRKKSSSTYNHGPLYIYNNVFYNLYNPLGLAATTKNNILYQCTKSGGFGTGNLVTSTNQFVNPTGGDFHLLASAAARDAGSALSSPYNMDPDGNIRGADGKWDLGMYEYTNLAVNNFKLQIPNRKFQIYPSLNHTYNILGQIINKTDRTGIYLVVPENSKTITTRMVIR